MENKPNIIYLVQVGRYDNSYKTKYKFDRRGIVEFHYKGLNISNGYKKRLIKREDGKSTTLLRYISSR